MPIADIWQISDYPLQREGVVSKTSYLNWQSKKKELSTMLTIKQAAQQANVHRDTIARAIKTQKLPAQQAKGKYRMEWRIKQADLDAWMQQAGTDVVTLPVATYNDMQQALTTYSNFATALMAEIRSMQDASAQQAGDTQRELAEIRMLLLDKKPWYRKLWK
jgi:excisionase family DNA binding protein